MSKIKQVTKNIRAGLFSAYMVTVSPIKNSRYSIKVEKKSFFNRKMLVDQTYNTVRVDKFPDVKVCKSSTGEFSVRLTTTDAAPHISNTVAYN